MSTANRVGLLLASLFGGLLILIGIVGITARVTGQKTALDPLEDLAISSAYLLFGIVVLQGFVRRRSPRAWATTVTVLGVIMVLEAVITTLGNLLWDLDTRNWAWFVSILGIVGVALLAIGIRSRNAKDGIATPPG